jgi:transcriptional regulator with XRE-family HTH domain
MTTLSDVALLLRTARKQARLTQAELAERAGVARHRGAHGKPLQGRHECFRPGATVGGRRLHTKVVPVGHQRTVEEILAEQRRGYVTLQGRGTAYTYSNE